MKSRIYIIIDEDNKTHHVVSNNNSSAVDVFKQHYPTKTIKRHCFSRWCDLALMSIVMKEEYNKLLFNLDFHERKVPLNWVVR